MKRTSPLKWMKWLCALLLVSSVICHAQNSLSGLAGQRMLYMGEFSIALPDFLQPVVWQKDRCRMSIASTPVEDSPARRKHAFATWEKWHTPEKDVFIGRYDRSDELGQPTVFLLSRIPSKKQAGEQAFWQPGIRLKSVVELDDKIVFLSADCETRKPETAIALVTQNLFQPVGPLPDPNNKASSPTLRLDTNTDGPGKAFPRFVGEGKGLTVSITFNDIARSNDLVPMTMSMRLLHAIFGKPDESVSYVRHGEKKAGTGANARAGKENIYGVTLNQKESPREDQMQYRMRAHWHDDQTPFHIEMNEQRNTPIPQEAFLALWDQLLEGVVFTAAQP